jgi:hypothetical protein
MSRSYNLPVAPPEASRITSSSALALEYGGGILLNALLGCFRVCVGHHYNSPKRSLMLDLSASNLLITLFNSACVLYFASEARH